MGYPQVAREDRWRRPKVARSRRRILEAERRRVAKEDALLPTPSEKDFVDFLEQSMKAPPANRVIYVSASGLEAYIKANVWSEPPRADGLATEDAWLLCPCGEEWWFDPVPLGDYRVSPCGHIFLQHMTELVAAFAGIRPPRDGVANYRVVAEPPQ